MSRRKWSREKIIEDVRALAAAGHSLSTRSMAELGYSGMVTTSYKPEYFGSWRNAIVAAGLDPKEVCRRKRKWTRERILQRIQELHREGEDLSHSAAKRHHQYLVVVAINDRFFGSWREAIEAAEIDYEEVSKHEYWSRDRICERIRELHVAGESLSHEDAKRYHGALVSAASSPRYFGSWGSAIRSAGLDYDQIRKINRWTRAKIIDTITSIHQQGESVSNSNMRRLGYRGLMEAACRSENFGTWADAVRSAGIQCDDVA
jgi:tRNA A37 N6-isopentenylltransferase MiaA